MLEVVILILVAVTANVLVAWVRALWLRRRPHWQCPECTLSIQTDTQELLDRLIKIHLDSHAVKGLRKTELRVYYRPKEIREALDSARSVYTTFGPFSTIPAVTAILDSLITECNRHRPIGINGKHANLHTKTCGCTDKGPESTWGSVKPISEE